MTREEHYIKPSRVTSNKGVYYYNKAVDNCFDEFESRTCENCKDVYMCDIDGHVCNNEKSKLFCSKVDNTVYCNKFVSTNTKEE